MIHSLSMFYDSFHDEIIALLSKEIYMRLQSLIHGASRHSSLQDFSLPAVLLDKL